MDKALLMNPDDPHLEIDQPGLEKAPRRLKKPTDQKKKHRRLKKARAFQGKTKKEFESLKSRGIDAFKEEKIHGSGRTSLQFTFEKNRTRKHTSI